MRGPFRFLGTVGLLLLSSFAAQSATAQQVDDRFRAAIGMDKNKPRIAASDFAPRADFAKTHSQQFTQIVRDDLQFSGIIELVSPSFYPQMVLTTPNELRPQGSAPPPTKVWTDPPVNSSLLAFGNLTESSAEVAIEGYCYDIRSTPPATVVAKIYRGVPTDANVRKFAHQFADEIISKLSGGIPGIAATQIAFISSRTGSKEVWVMDYDGANQHPITNLRTISLTPRWSPDASRIAFTCYEPLNRVVSAQICMYSMDTGKVVAFPRFPGTNSAPTWSPDGSQLMFSSSMQGTPDLYVTDASGSRPKRLTFSGVGGATSPTWNPKTGQTVVFVSDRGGIPKLYTMNADGTNSSLLDLPDKGYVIDPAWSPNGQILAFSWRRPDGNYDIYIMDPTSLRIFNITPDAGARNERPSWAPDGRHIVFESTRTGQRQIWSMLADGTEARQLTNTGHNESPNWSTR